MCYNYTQCTSGIPLFLLFHTALFLLLFTFPFFFPLLLPAFWITSRELSSLSLFFFFFFCSFSLLCHIHLIWNWLWHEAWGGRTKPWITLSAAGGEEKDTTRNAHHTHTTHTHTHTHTQTRSTTFRIRSSGRLIKAIWLVGDVWIYIENQEI